jgi:transcriptional regulator with XRE-family HTH domain
VPTPSRALQLLGRTIRRLRKQRRLSQEALAERARMHLNHISSIERGERNPGFLSLLKLSRGLDVPITALFDEFPPSTVRRLRL